MIFNIIDGALEKIGVPFYDHMPEFAEGEADELFLSYSIYDRPQLHGDGAEVVTRYFVTVSVFGRNVEKVDETYSLLLAQLRNSGFLRAGGSYSSNNDFPKYYRYAADFFYDHEL